MGDDRGELVAPPLEVVHRDAVLTVRRAVRAKDRELFVVELIHIEGRDRIMLRQAREINHSSPLGRNLERRLLRLFGRRGDDDPLGSSTFGVRHCLCHAVVLPRDPGIVDEASHGAQRDLEPL